MREIKFRAWVGNPINLMRPVTSMEWVGEAAAAKSFDVYTPGSDWLRFYSGAYDGRDKDWTIMQSGFTKNLGLDRDKLEVYVMQYTGLKDKNGVEIYEGDIMQDDLFSSTNVVKFGEYWEAPEQGAYGWYRESVSHQDFVSGLITGIAVSEVIGNIYENPELLKDTEKE